MGAGNLAVRLKEICFSVIPFEEGGGGLLTYASG